MKRNALKFIIFNFVIALLLSCNGKDDNFQSEHYEIKDGYKKHEIIFENKRISFVIPEYYSDTYIPSGIMLDRWHGTDKKYVFYSTKNKYNSFSFIVVENDYDESTMDTGINQWIQVSIYMDPPIVPFYEKKKNKNNHVFYLYSSSCFDFLNEESHLPKEDQNCVFSNFGYVTYFKEKCYAGILETREKISEFSYEGKKYIIESVRIEEIEK
jgi:hypothetical protein